MFDSALNTCLDNCSVICTVTLCYVLHQTYSESWHIEGSVYSGSIFSIIKTLFTHIEALLKHI